MLLPVIVVWAVSADAGTTREYNLGATTLPAAFAEFQEAEDEAVVVELRRRLPPHMSVISHGHFVIAASGSIDGTMRQGKRIASYEAQMRERSFPGLETRRILVILGDDSSTLHQLAETFYPTISVSEKFDSSFYHRQDRLILATTAGGYGAVLHELMRALLQDDNPNAPLWFEDAAATLYESSDWRADRLTPIPDPRMEHISPDEDLAYDVFAGICDCSQVSPEQLALMRLLLIFLDRRDQLDALHAAIKRQGQYTTLLQALEAMELDRAAWKEFAERSVRTYSR